jgi:hypothetical protein
VKKIEKIIVYIPQRRCINRYLIKKRPEIRELYSGAPAMASSPGGLNTIGFPGMVDHGLCTDKDIIEIFNKNLRNRNRGRVT